MLQTSLTFLGLAGLLLLVCSGCSHPTTLGANTGVAYGMAKQNQMLNPDAEGNLEPVVGMEGNVAKTAMELYRTGFEKEGQGLGKSAVASGIQTK
jgi:hypothetical protein